MSRRAQEEATWERAAASRVELAVREVEGQASPSPIPNPGPNPKPNPDQVREAEERAAAAAAQSKAEQDARIRMLLTQLEGFERRLALRIERSQLLERVVAQHV